MTKKNMSKVVLERFGDPIIGDDDDDRERLICDRCGCMLDMEGAVCGQCGTMSESIDETGNTYGEPLEQDDSGSRTELLNLAKAMAQTAKNIEGEVMNKKNGLFMLGELFWSMQKYTKRFEEELINVGGSLFPPRD